MSPLSDARGGMGRHREALREIALSLIAFLGIEDSSFLSLFFICKLWEHECNTQLNFLMLLSQCGQGSSPSSRPLFVGASPHWGCFSASKTLTSALGKATCFWAETSFATKNDEKLHSEMNLMQSSGAMVMIGLRKRQSGLTSSSTHLGLCDLWTGPLESLTKLCALQSVICLPLSIALTMVWSYGAENNKRSLKNSSVVLAKSKPWPG